MSENNSGNPPVETPRDKSKLLRATVAPGHTIHIPTRQKKSVGMTPDLKPVTTSVTREFGPGQEVELPEEEVDYLRRTGFLVDPENQAPPVLAGARVIEGSVRR